MPPARPGAAAVSVGVSLPEAVVPNAEIEGRLGLAPGWIARRSSASRIRVAVEGVTAAWPASSDTRARSRSASVRSSAYCENVRWPGWSLLTPLARRIACENVSNAATKRSPPVSEPAR